MKRWYFGTRQTGSFVVTDLFYLSISEESSDHHRDNNLLHYRGFAFTIPAVTGISNNLSWNNVLLSFYLSHAITFVHSSSKLLLRHREMPSCIISVPREMTQTKFPDGLWLLVNFSDHSSRWKFFIGKHICREFFGFSLQFSSVIGRQCIMRPTAYATSIATINFPINLKSISSLNAEAGFYLTNF